MASVDDLTMEIFDERESEVRSYCRDFPVVFARGRGAQLWDVKGRAYIDFFAGAGALNYGHNPPEMKKKLLEYLADDGVVHGLDMATSAKAALLERFHEVILAPRGMDHRLVFPGPTGTNAVEAAIKIARLVTGRSSIISFTNAFHGMTMGALALTGNGMKRAGAGVPLTHAERMPFDGYLGADVDTLAYLERCLEDGGSGVDMPAAVIVETIQAEGGLNVARFEWLRRLEKICRRHDIPLIIGDIQVGCGRTGPFFSFEPAGLEPDVICLSKSISGYGLPLALTLVKPQYDCFSPGQHNGTFRGNNLGFVTAVQALEHWRDDGLSKEVVAKGEMVRARLERLLSRHAGLDGEARGRGLIQGLVLDEDGLADEVCAAAFERGLIMETSGANSEVVKILPPLVIDEASLAAGLDILDQAVAAALAARRDKARHVA